MKRIFDFILALFLFIAFLPIFLLVMVLIKRSDPGPALYWSKRVGKNNSFFMMPKFRSMRLDTPQVATHLMTDPEKYLIPIGAFIRKTSLDELPQLISVLTGEMSFVGPRPALFNQDDLMALRNKYGVEKLTPGITGWAQINGRDEISIEKKVELEVEYLKKQSFWFDLKIIFMTGLQVIRPKGVSH